MKHPHFTTHAQDQRADAREQRELDAIRYINRQKVEPLRGRQLLHALVVMDAQRQNDAYLVSCRTERNREAARQIRQITHAGK